MSSRMQAQLVTFDRPNLLKTYDDIQSTIALNMVSEDREAQVGMLLLAAAEHAFRTGLTPREFFTLFEGILFQLSTDEPETADGE